MFSVLKRLFFKVQSFMQKKNFELKMPYMGIFRVEFEKRCCHISNQHP